MACVGIEDVSRDEVDRGGRDIRILYEEPPFNGVVIMIALLPCLKSNNMLGLSTNKTHYILSMNKPYPPI